MVRLFGVSDIMREKNSHYNSWFSCWKGPLQITFYVRLWLSYNSYLAELLAILRALFLECHHYFFWQLCFYHFVLFYINPKITLTILKPWMSYAHSPVLNSKYFIIGSYFLQGIYHVIDFYCKIVTHWSKPLICKYFSYLSIYFSIFTY